MAQSSISVGALTTSVREIYYVISVRALNYFRERKYFRDMLRECCFRAHFFHGLLSVIDSITNFLDISADPAAFIQAAVPQIIERTKGAFFERIVDLLRETAEICYDKMQEISCITCPSKPEASMFVMVKVELSLLDGITDDVDFCMKLSKEESVILCPGSSLGMKNWLRVTFAVEPSALELGLERLKSFCKRHEKKQSK